jgi:hypothetical protein
MNEGDGEKIVATMRALRAAPFAEWTKASVEFEDNLPGMHDFSRWTCDRQYTIYRDHALARYCAALEIHGKSWSINSIRQADCEKEGKSWTINRYEQARLDGMRKLVSEYLEWKRVSCSV